MEPTTNTGPLERIVSQPRRVQLSRAKGWRMPENTRKVDRSTRFGNWHRVGVAYDARPIPETAEQACAQFAEDLESMQRDDPELFRAEWIEPLRGRNLSCWCALDKPCHADVLIRLANID